MRIKRITAENFGKFERFAVNIDNNLTLFFGPNEAGKTTLFEMFAALLYAPMNQDDIDRNIKLIKYGCPMARISGIFENDGKEISVAREIYPDTTNLIVADESSQEELGNVNCDLVGDLAKDMFVNIYALNYTAMATISDDVYKEIQHSILKTDTASNLRSAEEAIDILAKKSDELWRMDNFSGQKIKELIVQRDEKLIELDSTRKQQRKMLENDSSIKDMSNEISDINNNTELERLFLKEADKMNQLRSNIQLVQILSKKLEDFKDLEKWMPNIESSYDELINRINSNNDKLEDLLSSINDWIEEGEIDELHSEILDIKDEILSLDPRKTIVIRESGSSQEAKDNFNKCIHENLENVGNIDVTKLALDRINVNKISSKIDEYKQLKVNSVKVEEKKEEMDNDKSLHNIAASMQLITLVFIILGVFGLFIGKIVEFIPALGVLQDLIDKVNGGSFSVGIAFMLIGLVVTITSFIIKLSRKKSLITQADTELSSIVEKMNSLKDDIANGLHGLGIRKKQLNDPSEKIVGILNDLNIAYAAMKAALDNDKEIIENVDKKKILQLAEIYLEDIGDNETDCIMMLKTMLSEANMMKQRKTQTQEIISKKQGDIDELENTIRIDKEQLNNLCEILGENPKQRAKYIDDANIDLIKATKLRDAMMQSITNFEEVSSRLLSVSGQGWPYSEEALQASEARIIEYKIVQDNLYVEIGKIQQELEYLSNTPTPNTISAQIYDLENEIKHLEMLHDKYVLASVIIRIGAQNYSKMNQQEMLKKASSYLEILTEGRYDKLGFSQKNNSITLRDMNSDILDTTEIRLSQATREQLFLSLRLALIDSFSKNENYLPIFMDETLITWDNARLESGVELINDISEKRQVIIFTCHDWLRDIFIANVENMNLVELTN